MLPLVVHWAPVRALSATRQQALRLLDSDERARAARLVFDADRDAFVTAHALLRTVLGATLGIDGAAVRFAYTSAGRPELAGIAAGDIAFSLTHTRALVACAIGPALPLGVDAEAEADTTPDEALAVYCCTPRERTLLAGLAPGERAWAFAQMWTTKEATLKALGLGLGVPPTEVECALDPPCVVRAPEPEGSGRWFVRSYEPRPHVALTVATYAPYDPVEPYVAELRELDTILAER